MKKLIICLIVLMGMTISCKEINTTYADFFLQGIVKSDLNIPIEGIAVEVTTLSDIAPEKDTVYSIVDGSYQLITQFTEDIPKEIILRAFDPDNEYQERSMRVVLSYRNKEESSWYAGQARLTQDFNLLKR